MSPINYGPDTRGTIINSGYDQSILETSHPNDQPAIGNSNFGSDHQLFITNYGSNWSIGVVGRPYDHSTIRSSDYDPDS